jgi:N-methylhydantoinase A
MLRVGPRSAGSVPGPACYGWGGTDPTVTDALLVLGYLAPEKFLGGDMLLDLEAAVRACGNLGAQLGMDAYETAWGIRQVATAGMITAVRSRLAARGLDPREQMILSYGGCGGLFTPSIGEAIGSRGVLIPGLASVLSAFGAATTDVRRERIKAVLEPMPIDPMLLEKLGQELEAQVNADLEADGIEPSARTVGFEADLRFKRQVWEISIPLATRQLERVEFGSLVDSFKDEYAKRYGRGSIVLGAPVEFVNLRAVGAGRTVQASLEAGHTERVQEGTRATAASTRLVRVGRHEGGDHAVDVYEGRDLLPGHTLEGPALIEGIDTTVWVPARAAVTLTAHGTYAVELAQ